MAKIILKNVSKSYKRSEMTLHSANIEIDDGEFVVIVGPSGCGKSTLLRLIAGLEEVTSGEIAIDGKIVNNLEPVDRNIAMVFQNYALYPHMTVYDNMSYGLKNKKIPKQKILERVHEVAELLEIKNFLERRPHELSGGQRQRVAMGRAIVRNPVAFLFDEPLSNLDASLRVQMRLEIRKLQKRMKTTTIYVTHDQIEAMTLADKLIVIRDGKIEQIGKPLEIYNHPLSTFVGKFIGSPAMEFITAHVGTNLRSVKLLNNIVVQLPGKLENNKPGAKVYLGIRPEHWSISSKKDRSALSVDVNFIESLGGSTVIYGHLRGIKTEQVSIKISGDYTNYMQDQSHIFVKIKPSCINVFEYDTKKRLDIFGEENEILRYPSATTIMENQCPELKLFGTLQ